VATRGERLHIRGRLDLDLYLGALRLAGSRIGGRLNLGGAIVCNSDGPALVADGPQTDGGVFLDGGFVAEGASECGAVRLAGARGSAAGSSWSAPWCPSRRTDGSLTG